MSNYSTIILLIFDLVITACTVSVIVLSGIRISNGTCVRLMDICSRHMGTL